MKKIQYIVFSLLLLLSFSFASAQALTKKEKKKIRIKAENLFDKGDYYNSLQLFEQLLQADSLDPYLNYHAGVCKYNIKRLRYDALKNFERAKVKPVIELYYYLGNMYHLHQMFSEAMSEYEKYLLKKSDMKEHSDQEITLLLEKCAYAMKELSRENNIISISNIGEKINSPYPEYVPLVSADGKKLFFTSRREGSSGNRKDPMNDYYEDVYMAEYLNGQWKNVIRVDSPVNTRTHDACVGLTPEGENLLIYRTSASLVAGDIYLTTFDGTKWSDPVLLDEEINSPEWVEASACFSSDGNTIYFSSNRPGGYGGKDIYRSVKLPNGEWSKAVNLGSEINTMYDEDAPFIHPDDDKLYFSSTGHPGMGGYDIYRSDRDEAGNWQKPVNLGYPLNTVDDDIYFVLSADGSTGYFSSKREDGFGETDIYIVTFRDNFGYKVVTGFVLNEEKSPVDAKLVVLDKSSRKINGEYHSNPLTGRFIILLEPDKEYSIVVEAKKYYSITEDIEPSNETLQYILKRKDD
ncbi:MAG: hypothetical protein ACOZCO_13290 [Bacteroidota bacterium]